MVLLAQLFQIIVFSGLGSGSVFHYNIQENSSLKSEPFHDVF